MLSNSASYFNNAGWLLVWLGVSVCPSPSGLVWCGRVGVASVGSSAVLSVCLSVCLSACLGVCVTDCWSVWLSGCLSAWLSVVCLAGRPPGCLACPARCLSVWLSVCLSGLLGSTSLLLVSAVCCPLLCSPLLLRAVLILLPCRLLFWRAPFRSGRIHPVHRNGFSLRAMFPRRFWRGHHTLARRGSQKVLACSIPFWSDPPCPQKRFLFLTAMCPRRFWRGPYACRTEFTTLEPDRPRKRFFPQNGVPAQVLEGSMCVLHSIYHTLARRGSQKR